VGGVISLSEAHVKLINSGPDRVNPFTVPKLMVNAASGNVAIMFGFQGPNSATATACASSGHAIGAAYDMMQRGLADIMVAGGSEAAVTPLCLAAFMTMKALSTRNDEPEKASRPFDKDRDGFVLGEGCGTCVLETAEHARKRGAPILAELCGIGYSCDADHITAPQPDGHGAANAMRWALQEAHIDLDQVDYINAHGTSTPLGDTAELRAVRTLFGEHVSKISLSSTKSMTGHGLGASGAIELIPCVLGIQNNVCVPTINLDDPEDSLGIELVANQPREKTIRYALNNTFGFGGHNVSIVVGAYTD
jgi:3-oxoacyl-[acyl-carrier-protein] synthase II